ncbi:hypothetical protein IMZ29_00855 [Achromobacter sp. GG226]|uniref:hypothetical protein n=1 Tax=Verticiella alkaliphila TaxID=2779529 RepID=UPI001C0B67E5|nr:hypothetical protein [Verticiella sp. GG226]MBU4609152.1 hypothetical protein [Verticiella sp. GG226]
MKGRCDRASDDAFDNYGGRGISYDKSWSSFEAFLADMGDAPDGMSLDRIDVNGNYEKANCRWATRIQQQNNMRTNRHVEHDGRRLTIAEWARETGLAPHVIRKRLNKGWSVEAALLTPKSERHAHASV